MRGAPSTDPGVRNSRTGLLPWVVTPDHDSDVRDLPYPLQRTVHALSALCPIRVALSRVPLGQVPSLQRLFHQFPSFVRRFLRYYGPVRLPLPVHHRRTSIDFPMRPARSSAGRQGISQLLSEVLPCMLRIFDSAGSRPVLRLRRTRCCLPHPYSDESASEAGEVSISELNTRPTRTPVNASPTNRQKAESF